MSAPITIDEHHGSPPAGGADAMNRTYTISVDHRIYDRTGQHVASLWPKTTPVIPVPGAVGYAGSGEDEQIASYEADYERRTGLPAPKVSLERWRSPAPLPGEAGA